MQTGLGFSTNSLPSAERLEAWADFFASSHVRVRVETPNRSTFKAHAQLYRFGTMRMLAFELGPISLLRTRDLLSDGDDCFSLVVCTAGSFNGVLAEGSHALVAAGDAALLRHDMPVGTVATSGISGLALAVPRRALGSVGNTIERLGAVPLPADRNALTLLASYVRTISAVAPFLSPQLSATIEGHILDLVACSFAPVGDWARGRANGDRQSQRVEQLLQMIAERARNPATRASSLAVELGISLRQIHLLLEATGRTFSDHLRERRLQAARQMLASPRFSSFRVIDIAFPAGFSRSVLLQPMFPSPLR